MGDRITQFRKCPQCGGKDTLVCYEALSSFLKYDECIECGYEVKYIIKEINGLIEIEVEK